MPEVIERFIDCANEYFADVVIIDLTDNAITFSVTDVDDEYIAVSLQSICEDLEIEFEVTTGLNLEEAPTYTFSCAELTE